MANKVHTSALVVIPDEDKWTQIQEIRKTHDKAYSRWMPHINMLYPFITESEYKKRKESLRAALQSVEPFVLRFVEYGYFSQGKSNTLYLIPQTEPPLFLVDLENKLQTIFPNCTDLSTISPSGFSPHLTVGQFNNSVINSVQTQFTNEFIPIEMKVTHLHFISRQGNDPFRIKDSIPLGGADTSDRKRKEKRQPKAPRTECKKKSEKQKQTSTTSNKEEEKESEIHSVSVTEKAPRPAKQPTHLLAIRITNPEIVQKLTELQSTFVEKYPHLKDGMISPTKFQLTLMTMNLSEQGSFDSAIKSLRSCTEIIKKFENLQFSIQSVGHFNSQQIVMFACKKDSDLEKLTDLEEQILYKFREDLPMVDLPEIGNWEPHITFYKQQDAAKPPSDADVAVPSEDNAVQATIPISEEFLQSYKDSEFGVQEVSEIQFLQLKSAPDGYYVCHANLNVDGQFETLIERKRKELMAARQERRKQMLQERKRRRGEREQQQTQEIDLTFWDTLEQAYPPLEVDIPARIPRIIKKVQKWQRTPATRRCLPKTRAAWYEVIKPFCKLHVEALPPDFIVYKLQNMGFVSVDGNKITYLRSNFNQDTLLDKDVYDKLNDVQLVQHRIMIRCFEWVCRVMSFGPQTYHGLLNSLGQMCGYDFEISPQTVIDELIKRSIIKGIK